MCLATVADKCSDKFFCKGVAMIVYALQVYYYEYVVVFLVRVALLQHMYSSITDLVTGQTGLYVCLLKLVCKISFIMSTLLCIVLTAQTLCIQEISPH